MSSYSIVLAPLAGLMAVDFFIVKKGKYDVYELYKPDGIYRYFGGWNWRSYTALLVAVALNLPGMINAIQPTVEIGNIYYLYMLSNVTGVSQSRIGCRQSINEARR
jgi:NCS1 family nucleobase:cation symporter-1